MIGREVPYRLLEAVVDVHGDRLEEACAKPSTRTSCEPGTEGLTFRHALLQEAVAAQPAARRGRRGRTGGSPWP